MSNEIDDLRARREAIENTAVGASRRRGMLPILGASALTATLAVGGYALYDNLSGTPDLDTSIQTSGTTEFPDDRDAGDSLELPDAPTPIVIDRPVIQEVTDSATLARLADLELQLQEANARIEASVDETESEHASREELQRERDRFAQELRSLTSTAQNDQDRARETQANLEAQVANLTRSFDQDRNAWQTEKTQIEMAAGQAARESDARLDAMKLEFDRLLQEANETDPAEDERRRRFEELRAEEEAAQAARINSGMVVLNNAGVTEAGAQESRTLSDNESFVRRAIEDVPVSTAAQIGNPQATVLQGTIIQASLETAIDSSLPGQIRAVVNEHVYSMDGSAVLIPAGSKVFGEYSDGVQVGQRRILIAWTRIITPSNRSVSIASYGGDQLGRSGTSGYVDTRFGARFGSAALISIIGAAPAVIANRTTDNALAQETIEDLGGDFGSATASSVGEVLSIQPTIYVRQGSSVSIILDRDVEIF